MYSNDDYPQFRYGTATENEIYISFNERSAGYIKNGDTSVTVTNTGRKPITLSSLTVDGIFCCAKDVSGAVIAPGESKAFELKGCKSFKNNETARVKAAYKIQKDDSSVLKSKTFVYTAIS